MGYSKREVVLVVVLAMAAMMVEAEAAVTCGFVSNRLSGCLTYLVARAPAPSSGCCNGVVGLYRATSSLRADRITSCVCIKTLAASLATSLNSGNIASLPAKCGVNLGYGISINTDCNSIP